MNVFEIYLIISSYFEALEVVVLADCLSFEF